MNNQLISLLFSLSIFLVGCGGLFESSLVETHTRNSHKSTETIISSQRKDASPPNKGRPFSLDFGDYVAKGYIDDQDYATITNWPQQWHVKAELVQYKGREQEEPLFSEKRCQSIREDTSSILGFTVVRSGYYSELNFTMPIFLHHDFLVLVQNALIRQGFEFRQLKIKNPILEKEGIFKMDFAKDAISNILGSTKGLADKYNLINRGHISNPVVRSFIFTEGDLICDLISGKAKMTVIHGVEGEDYSVKLIYDPVKINLKTNSKN